MSLDDLRNIQSRIDKLKGYIQVAAQKKHAFFGDLKPIIDEACRLLPTDVMYDALIQNVDVYLPHTIDATLKHLKTQTEQILSDTIDTKQPVLESYARHIMSEVTGITTQLQTFRISHTHTHNESGNGSLEPHAHMNVTLLLQQLHSMK